MKDVFCFAQFSLRNKKLIPFLPSGIFSLHSPLGQNSDIDSQIPFAFRFQFHSSPKIPINLATVEEHICPSPLCLHWKYLRPLMPDDNNSALGNLNDSLQYRYLSYPVEQVHEFFRKPIVRFKCPRAVSVSRTFVYITFATILSRSLNSSKTRSQSSLLVSFTYKHRSHVPGGLEGKIYTTITP